MYLQVLFVATDASEAEWEEFKAGLAGVEVVRFEPSEEDLEELRDGGVAIVDQAVCRHATYFVGTRLKTNPFLTNRV